MCTDDSVWAPAPNTTVLINDKRSKKAQIYEKEEGTNLSFKKERLVLNGEAQAHLIGSFLKLQH